MAEIDRLEITLKSNAKDVANDFDRLSSSVDKTSKALTGMDAKSFGDLAKGIKSIANTSSKTDKLDESLSKIATSLNKFASSINQIDTSKFDQISAKLDKIAEIGSKNIEAAAKSIRSLDKAASDTSGAKKGKQSYDEFMQSIKGLGSDRNFYGNLQQIGTEIERTRNKIEKVNSAIEKYNAEGRSVETKGWRSAQMQLEQYSNYLDNLIAKQKEMSTQTSANMGLAGNINFAPNFEDRLYQMSDEVQKWYSEVQATIRNMGDVAINEGYFEKLKGIVIQPNLSKEQILDQMDEMMLELHQKFQAEPLSPQVQIDLEEFARKAESESQKINERLKNALSITPTVFGSNQRYSEEYIQLEKQIKKAEGELEKLLNTQERLDETGVKKSSQRYKNVEYNIEQVDKKLQQLYSDMQNLQASGKDVVNISQFEILSEQASNARNIITTLAQSMRALGFRGVASSIQSIGSEVGSLSQGLAGTAKAAEGAGSAMSAMQTAIPVIGLVLVSVTLVIKAYAKLAKMAINAFKSIVNGIKTVVGKMKDLANNIISVGTSTYKANTLIGKFLQKIVNTFKSRVLRRAITQFYTSITDGFKALDEYSESIGSKFHPNLQSLIVDLKVLGRSIAAAFEPILNVATPILDFLIQKVITVINYINQFFSALSGSDTWTRATATASDYASAATGASKAQKDLNKSIREWDKLNVITDPNKNSGGGGGGSSSGGGGGFTTEDVESPIKNLAKRIKETWEKNADFTWLGEDIGNKVKEKLDGIQWEEKIKPAAEKFGKALATTINGFVEVPGLADTIGNTIAEAINTMLTFFDSFVSNIHGDSIGTFIGELVGTALDDIEWDKYIHGMGKLGEELAKGVNALAETDVLSSISRAFANILKGAIEGAYQFVTGVKWGNLGKKIGDSINEFFKKMNEVDEDGMTGFQKAGATVNELANGLLDMVTNAVETVEWEKVGQSIADFIKEIDFVGIFKKVKDLKDKIKTAIFDTIKGALPDISWSEIGSKVVEFFTNIDWGNNFALELPGKLASALLGALSAAIQLLFGMASKLSENLSDLFETLGLDGVAGFFKGISDNLKESATWVKEKFQIVIDAIKDFFGIHSPSTVLAEIGGFLIDGLKQGISDAISSIKEWIQTNVIDKVKNAFGDASTWLADKALEIKANLPDIVQGIKDKWDEIKQWLVDKALDIAANIPDIVQKIKDKIGEIKTWLTTNLLDIGANIPDIVQSVKDKIGEIKTWLTTNLLDIGANIPDIVQSVKDKIGEIKTWLTTNLLDIGANIPDIVQSVKDKIGEIKTWLTTNLLDIGANIPDIVQKVKDKIGEIKTWLESNKLTIGADLKENIGEKIDNLKKKWEKVKFKKKKLTAKVKGGAIDAIKKVKTAWSNLKGGTKVFRANIAGTAKKALEKIKSLWEGLSEKAKTLSVAFNDNFTAPIKRAWNALARSIDSFIDKIPVVGSKISSLPKFPGYATGGFPEDGWFRASQGEIMGRFDNGKSVVANNEQITNGISNAVYRGNRELVSYMQQQVAQLQQQNSYLYQILQKETGIDYRDVFKATQKGANEYKSRTGKPAFV